MSIIKEYKEIEMLIPKRDYTFYKSPIQNVEDLIILNNPIYAIIVGQNGKVAGAYKAVFFVQRIETRFKLFLTNISKDNATARDYVYVNDDKEPWPFKTDKIGLYLQSEAKSGNKIYFGTSMGDFNKVRKELGDTKIAKRILYAAEVVI